MHLTSSSAVVANHKITKAAVSTIATVCFMALMTAGTETASYLEGNRACRVRNQDI